MAALLLAASLPALVTAVRPEAAAAGAPMLEHVDDIPSGVTLDPVPALDPARWVGTPILREAREGGVAPAMLVLDAHALGLDAAALRGMGLATVSFADLPRVTDAWVLDHGVPEREADARLQGAGVAATGPAMTVYHDDALKALVWINGPALANTAWADAVSVIGRDSGASITRVTTMSTPRSTPNVDDSCQMQAVAKYEAGFATAGDAVVIFSPDRVTHVPTGTLAYGLQVDGPVTTQRMWGESVKKCVGGGRVTPRYIPSAYVAVDYETNVVHPATPNAAQVTASYLAAHEIGHVLGMEHRMAWCHSEGLHQHQSIEAFTTGGGKPAHCTDIANYVSTHVHWTFYLASGGGAPAMASENAAWSQCLSGGWCSRGNAPGPVTTTTASPGDGRVTLSWSAPPNGGGAIDQYRIYRSTSPGAQPLDAPLATRYWWDPLSYTDTAVTNGVTYYYHVRAFNMNSATLREGDAVDGEGPRGNEASAKPARANNPPYMPSSYSPGWGASVSNPVTFSWNGGDPDGGSVTYTVRGAKDGQPYGTLCGPVTSSASRPSCTVTLGAGAGLYRWYVIANDGVASPVNGETSEFTLTTSTTNRAPYTPSNVAPAQGSTVSSATVTWRWNGGDPDGDAVTYTIRGGEEGGSGYRTLCGPITSTLSQPSCTATLSVRGHYNWYVIASDGKAPNVSGPTWDFTY